tara:strand:- start:100 stop:1122 length:1023 start_codon:yes stop_codon:yes gene_type:complete
MHVLITGSAGFIGFNLCKRLIQEEINITGLDNLNNYYSVSLKKARLKELDLLSVKNKSLYKFYNCDLEDQKTLEKIFQESNPDIVINLAAQAGVRYSLTNPLAYVNSNIIGFTNLLEISRRNNIKHLIYASSSSVYGGNRIIPFKEKDPVDHPVSMYATSKRTNELMAHTYSHLYGLASTGLRFFTVYGPWGRPDMALFLFTKNIIEGKPIKVFNYGHMIRDFTYIDDIVESLFRLLNRPPKENLDIKNKDLNPSSSWAPHKIFNIGNSNPIELIKYIEAIEDALQIKAIKEYQPIQPGDVKTTSADTNSLNNFINFKPNTPVTEGVKKFVDWYRSFYSV